MSTPLEVFCCYAREDQEMLVQLKKHLAPLRRQGQIVIWSDTNLNAGVEWEKELHAHLESADIILLLISPDFMDSDSCYTEMERALARHHEGSAEVIPILLRPTFWQNAPFAQLQIVPTEARPVTSWPDRDAAFNDITKWISLVISVFFSRYPPTEAKAGLIEDSMHAEIALRGQQHIMHFADERSRQEVKARRRQFCIPALVSIHELALPLARLREAHDNLWARQKLLFHAKDYVKEVTTLFKTAHERAAVAGSELSIDPAGKGVMDAFVDYWTVRNEYVQAMLQPLRKVHTRFFGKTDAKVLDELAKKGDEKLTALEEAIRLYLDSPS